MAQDGHSNWSRGPNTTAAPMQVPKIAGEQPGVPNVIHENSAEIGVEDDNYEVSIYVIDL